jgi:hypothetical protein
MRGNEIKMNMPDEIYAWEFDNDSSAKRLVSGEGIWQSEEPHGIFDAVKYVKTPLWIPIDTAPLDTHVLLWYPIQKMIIKGTIYEIGTGRKRTPYPDSLKSQYCSSESCDCGAWCDYSEDEYPTHWMPIPDAPEVIV